MRTFMAFSFVASLLLVSSCSGDENTSTLGTPDAGVAGSGGVGGQGGVAGAGGMGGSGGVGGGSAEVCGLPQGEQYNCYRCYCLELQSPDGGCVDQHQECVTSPTICGDYIQCINNCGGLAVECQTECQTNYPDGFAYVTALDTCLWAECAAACAYWENM